MHISKKKFEQILFQCSVLNSVHVFLFHIEKYAIMVFRAENFLIKCLQHNITFPVIRVLVILLVCHGLYSNKLFWPQLYFIIILEKTAS
jgi:hypothetical protein